MQIEHKILCDEDRINFIRLARTNGVGSATFFKLINEVENFSDIVKFSEEVFAKKSTKRPVKIASKDQIVKEIEDSEKFGAKIILITDEGYPELLRNIPDPPPVITVKGDESLLDRDIIGIVGSRNASFHGANYAKYLAKELSKTGVVIASGLAKGIDGVAHEAALQNGTIGVIAAGIDNVYPSQNKELFAKMSQKGLIITEFAFGSSPKASNFVQRNRIISGLSYGVVVVEAAIKSGSLTTARFANEQGREVFAVPGFPSDSRSKGCNKLIDQGAVFLDDVEKIIEEIPTLRNNFRGDFVPIIRKFDQKELKIVENQEEVAEDLDMDSIYGQICAKLGSVEISIEDLYEIFANNVQDVNIALSELELEGKIEIAGGKVVRL